MKQMQEGVFLGVANEEYHRDAEWALPSLSSSLAKMLITETPRHCFYASERLSGKPQEQFKKEWDRGQACHALILQSDGDRNRIVIVEAENWRTKAAREAQKEARTAGMIPILSSDRDELFEAQDAWLEQLEKLEGGNPFKNGKPEVVIRWREELIRDGEVIHVWCRAKLDFLNYASEDGCDAKSSIGSVNPDRWCRYSMWDVGAPWQSAMYRSGLRRLTQIGALKMNDPDFKFILFESKRPYCVAQVAMPSDIRRHFREKAADEQVTAAMLKWHDCLTSGEWPGYDSSVYVPEGARPIVTRVPAEEEKIAKSDARFHADSDTISRGLAPAVDVNEDRDTSWAEGLVRKRK